MPDCHPGGAKEKAVDELVNGGYGFHPIWKNILEYVQNVDVEKIRAAVKQQ